jgi:hypothetical protein
MRSSCKQPGLLGPAGLSGRPIARRHSVKPCAAVLAAGIWIAWHAQPARAELPPIDDLSTRVAEAKASEMAALRNYTVLRHYVLTTEQAGQRAEMTVRVTYTAETGKRFEVVSERGSNFIERRVFHKLLEEEEEAARRNLRVTPENYIFRLEGKQMVDGRHCYVVSITPRVRNRFLVRGRAWVDAEDFSIVQVEGAPVGSNSFWIRDTHMVQRCRKVDGFWLPSVVNSTADIRVFGTAHLTIESRDYRINCGAASN